jgi:calcineurin-like phosphoesterase family protein
MAKIWFTSDLHFSNPTQMYHHPKRREAAGITLEELRTLPKQELIDRHDEWLINVWNNTVKRGDSIYHLGDFCLGNKLRTEYILSRLNGKKYFIKGNHDKSIYGSERFLEGFWIEKEVKFRHEQYPFIKEDETFCLELKHEPLLAWNRRPHGTCHIHGHTHGSIDQYNEDQEELRLDVGIDARISNYGFVDLETLYAHFRSIVENHGFETFQEYVEWLMAKQGFRM